MATRTLKVDNTTQNPESTSYPRIRLQGNWLAKAGFKPGDRLRVYVTQNRIEIRKEEG